MDESKAWHLGQTSERYESGGHGPGTISSGVGDPGGISYGQYQLSSAKGTVDEYLRWSAYGKDFDGLTINDAPFQEKWRNLAAADDNFGVDQHNFIKMQHYDVQVGRMLERGLDFSERGPAVQDAIWSTAVQYRNLTPGIFQKALIGKYGENADISSLTDKQIVETVQDYKYRTVEKYFPKAEKQWEALRNRAESEKASLADFAETGVPSIGNRVSHDTARSLSNGATGERVRELQQNLGSLGYLSSDGSAIHSDGHFGSKTREAVISFQRASGLVADGVAGPATMKAMDEQSQSRLRLNDVGHQDHQLFVQARSHISDIDKGLGRTPDQFTDHIAGALTVQARADGLHRIDQVALSPDGTKLWGVQIPPGRTDHLFDLRTRVPTSEANTPI